MKTLITLTLTAAEGGDNGVKIPADGIAIFDPKNGQVNADGDLVSGDRIKATVTDGVLLDAEGNNGVWLEPGQYWASVTSATSRVTKYVEVPESDEPILLTSLFELEAVPGWRLTEGVVDEVKQARDEAVAAAENAGADPERIAEAVNDVLLSGEVELPPGPEGPEGPQGPPGRDGIDGSDGRPGEPGRVGDRGPQGLPGEPGTDGASAYEVAVAAGFEGEESDWLASLKGPKGDRGNDGAQGPPGKDGAEGPRGLQGAPGEPGEDGRDGADGLSAYQIAVDEGFVGDEAAFLDSLVGPEGPRGPAGEDGAEGPEGPQGPSGEIPELLVGNIADATPTGKNLMLAATAGAARDTLGLATGATALNGALSELETGTSTTPRVWTPASIAEYATSKAREAAESAVASGPGSESRPEEFGAVGDGSTDDTNAIQAWLNSAPKRKVLSAGTYLVKELTLNAPDVSISSYGGTLLGSVAESTMLTVTSAGVSLDGVALNGDNKARQGVVFTGGGFASVTNSAARNFRSTVSTAAAVVFRDNIDGFTVSGCMFENVVSVGDTSIGNSNGAARGVWVTTANHEATGATAGRGVIHDNTFRGIEGEEGDAVQVVILPGYASGKCDIVGNSFHDFSRRAVKLQASDCIVSGNVMVSDAVSNGYAEAHCAVDSQYAENNVIKDNTIRLTGFSRGISVTGGDSGPGVPARGGIIVSGNLIHGGPIIMSNQQGPWVVDNTLFTGDSQYSIYVQASPGHVISSNTISANHVTDAATAHIYSGVQSDGSIVTDNKLVGGAREWLISVNSKDCIVRNNISTISSDFPRYQGNGVASANTVWEGNVASSASALFNGYNSVQVHRGFVNTRGPSYIPNVYFTTTDPATNGRSHTKGDIYFDFSITGTSAGFIGWVCTASGAPGTFRRFGALE